MFGTVSWVTWELGKGRGKTTNILRDFKFICIVAIFSEISSKFSTDKIRFYLDKQITFLNKLSEIIIPYDHQSE